VVAADHGEVLYTQVATTIATEVEKLAASLYSAASASDAEFLRELLGRWNKHCNAISMIGDVVMYLDRTFIQKTGKARASPSWASGRGAKACSTASTAKSR
jgi:cullin 3